MMNNSLKNQCKVKPGTIIEGKWHQNRYAIMKELGYGANGIVYLAQSKNQSVALKMSDNGMSITSEVNVLKSFAKVRGSTLGPSLLDVDDWKKGNGQVSFYVMEYIAGPNLLEFLNQKGQNWAVVLILQLLSDLELLHKSGWVFGDLKPENLIVTGPTPRIRCIDVGGTTLQGRAVKEFTEFYDRGYWGLGSRKAEPAYDLFSVGMIMINMVYPKRFNKTTGGLEQLKRMIEQKKELGRFEAAILRALKGEYNSASHMRDDLVTILNANSNQSRKSKPASSPLQSSRQTQTVKTRQTIVKKKKKRRLTETFLIITIISLLYILYIYGEIL